MSDGQTVLVVEDDPAIRSLLEAALSDEGLLVRMAPDGQAALAEAHNHCPDLVLLDMTLPDTTGAAVAAQLTAHCGPGVPIIVITADSSVEAKAKSIGAVAHLAKPFDVNRLVDLVMQHIARAA